MSLEYFRYKMKNPGPWKLLCEKGHHQGLLLTKRLNCPEKLIFQEILLHI